LVSNGLKERLIKDLSNHSRLTLSNDDWPHIPSPPRLRALQDTVPPAVTGHTTRPMSNRVRVQQHPTGQLTITFPRVLAQAMGIGKGDLMEWLLEDGKLVVKKVK